MTEPLVTMQGVVKRFDDFVAVHTLDLEIAAGDYVSLMGPSGSGKSTLLNLIAGIDKPTTGSLLIDGVDIAALPENDLAAWRAANVGFVFQFYNLMPVLNAFENVAFSIPRRLPYRCSSKGSQSMLRDRNSVSPRARPSFHCTKRASSALGRVTRSLESWSKVHASRITSDLSEI